MANTYPTDGNAGAGTDNPTYGLLQVQLTEQQAQTTRTGIALTVVGDNNPAMLYARPVPDGYNWLLTRNQQDDRGLMLDPAGNIELGKSLTVFGHSSLASVVISKDAVVGGILNVRDISVDGALRIKNWEISVPDYVFDDGYPLADLSEVAAHIRSCGHLPEIPSASEIEAEGLDVARMALLLLKKAEELTLYLLRHEERLDQIDRRLAALEAGLRGPSAK